MAKEPVVKDPEIRREWFSGSQPKPGIPGMEVVPRDDDEPSEDPSG